MRSVIIRMGVCGLFLAAGALSASLAGAADKPALEYPPAISLEEVRKWVDKAPAGHPRLLASKAELAALRASLQGDPVRRALADAVIKQANLLEDIPPITRTLEGRRLLGESRRCVKRTAVLATAYHLTGEKRHARRCQQEMLAVARFSDWNPSHFLDVAEMTFGMAIGYDWLHDQLDKAARDEIRKAIVEKGSRSLRDQAQRLGAVAE